MLLIFLHFIPCISSTSTSGISSISAKTASHHQPFLDRVNRQVQHYEIFLKKYSAGVMKLSFSLGLALIFFLILAIGRQAPAPVLADHGVNGLVRDTYALPLQTAGYLPWRPCS